ncbi:MAG: sorbosone dehydrogenase family protein [Deinococcales bacterium]|nr:sorbosone dehydrogenase family protein [Chitinophagaceae bacterium]
MKYLFISITTLISILSCDNTATNSSTTNASQGATYISLTDTLELPKPYATKSATNFSKVLGWPDGKTPTAPQGFTVTKFCNGLASPRNIYIGANGDIFISEANTEIKGILKVAVQLSGKLKSQQLGASTNRITLLRDNNHDGIAEIRIVFLTGLNQPYGMTIIDNKFYVANTDGLWQYPYKEGDTTITVAGTKILDLPAGGYNNHWTRNITTNVAKTKIYISVGSGTNIAEHGMDVEKRRANILEVNIDGTGEKVFASGLRNPCGIAFQPKTNVLYTVVNERDKLGDDLVPDYLTSVQQGGFYGWPYSYFGKNIDPRMNGERLDLVDKAIVPDLSLGAHTASLGLAFYTGTSFPTKYNGGIFIGQHGSWNSSNLTGYKVLFVPFSNGKIAGKPEDFLTGFVANKTKSHVYGRPVGVAVLHDGALLVADDAANTIWHIRANK